MKFSNPLTSEQVITRLNQYFDTYRKKNLTKPELQVCVTSEKLGLDYSYPEQAPDQPFHTASIGKVFTATLVQMLAEKGLLATSDPVSRYLSHDLLAGLFTFGKVDYSDQVTIHHLLGHTSGINDYIEGKSTRRLKFLDEVLAEPEHLWTPQELLDYTRLYQKAIARPGQKFFYSDTGYILLGLLIEQVTGKSFSRNLEESFFHPLEMNESYLMFYGQSIHQPVKPIEKIWLKGREVSEFKSLSCDWAGGGVVSTTRDLQKFHRALQAGRLIDKAALVRMETCQHRFLPGIHYGLGMMEIRFSEFFFLLRHLPRLKGHIGILATHMFYDPMADAYITMNFASEARMRDSFMALIEIENTLQKMR